MQRVYIALAIVALVIGGYFYFTSRQTASQTAKANSASVASSSPVSASAAAPSTTTPMYATIETNYGNIEFKFRSDLAPNAVANFIKLAQSGFYNGTRFHRVIKNFMIQGGDPLSKDVSKKALWGTGGPGYQFADEITPDSKNIAGSVAMANSGPNTNGSQFYINAVNNDFLDGKYVVFGEVVKGMDVVTKIDNVPTDSNDRPISDVLVSKVTVSATE